MMITFTRLSVLALPHFFLFLSSSSSPSFASSHKGYGDGSGGSGTDGTTYDVDVGNGGLVFSPDNLIASVGDTINFHFYPRNHSVVQSRFDSPCVPLGSINNSSSSGGTSAPAAAAAIYSDFIPTSEGEADTMFSIVVHTTDPIWLYCSQGRHCQTGMTMVVNAPTSGAKNLAGYRAAAAGVQTAQSPDTGVAGGIILPKSSGRGDGDGDGDGPGQGNRTSTSSGSGNGISTATANSTATSYRSSPTWSSASNSSASAAAATSVTVSTGAAPVSRPRAVAAMVVMGMLTVGLGMWTLL